MQHLPDYIQLLLDSSKYYSEQINTKNPISSDKERLAIGLIVNSWSALEGVVNHVAVVAKEARKLETHERAFLNEIELKLNDDGEFKECRSYSSTSKKILFLINRFSNSSHKVFKQSKMWNNIKISEDIRNSLVHPKENIVSKSYSSENALFVYKTVIESIKWLNKKTLRSKIFSLSSF